MCLALPARVISVSEDSQVAKVEVGGVIKDVSVALVQDVEINDYLLIHVGFALHKIDKLDAEKTLSLFAEAGLIENVGATAQ